MDGKLPRLDKSVLKVSSLRGDDDEKQYWLKKSPSQRLNAIEICRKMVYGTDRTSSRLQKIISVVDLNK